MLRQKLVKIGAKVVRHANAVTFQLAEVAAPRVLFAAIRRRIGRLRAAPSEGSSRADGIGVESRRRGMVRHGTSRRGLSGRPIGHPAWRPLLTAPNLADFL